MTSTNWGSPVEVEIRNRIRLSVAAYSYEVLSNSIMSDEEFDYLCLTIDPNLETGHPELDKFFREVFNPHTGMWILQHPEFESVEETYRKYYEIN